MNYTLRRQLFGGLLLLATSCGASAADMDRPLLVVPADEIPAEGEYQDLPDRNLSGFVEGSFAYGKGEVDGFSGDGHRWALRGAANVQMDSNWNAQFDGLYSKSSIDDVDVDSLIGAAHAYYRIPDAYAVGAFVQGSRFSSSILDVLAPLGLDNYVLDVVGGGEAAMFTDYATFHGQIGFGQASYSGEKVDHVVAKLGARVYATDNVRLDLEGIWNRLGAYGVNADVYSVSATGNYRLDKMPATLFAGYQYNYGELSAGGTSLGDASASTFRAGLRFHFGSSSLKDEERKGPVWSPSAFDL